MSEPWPLALALASSPSRPRPSYPHSLRLSPWPSHPRPRSGKRSLVEKAGEKRQRAEAKKARAEKKSKGKGKGGAKGGAAALKRPLTAFMLYCNNKRDKVVQENPEAKFTDISKILGEKVPPP